MRAEWMVATLAGCLASRLAARRAVMKGMRKVDP